MKAFYRALATAAAMASSADVWAQDAPRAKNVIVMIADGWGHNDVAATDYFQYGETGKQIYERAFAPLAMSTYPDGGGYDPQAFWSDPDYANRNPTDSAAAATAMGTGVKTYNGAIGVGPDKTRLANVVEAAKDLGKTAGVITTVPFSHATPAGFCAHNVTRSDYAGIAREMLLDSRLDVIMGAGHPWYDADGTCVATVDAEGRIASPQPYDYVGGPAVWLQLVSGRLGNDADGDGARDPWHAIESRDEFVRLAEGPTPKRVVGIARAKATLQQERSGDAMAAPGMVPPNPDVPTLAEMSLGAINVLDNDPDGFFLMIEGGAVDWANHDNQPGRMVEEMIDFDHAVEAVVQWVEQNNSWDETLVVVTGDHECGHLCGPDDAASLPDVESNGPGKLPNMKYRSRDHTNSLIPFYSKGPGTALFEAFADQTDPKRGPYLDNTELGKAVFAVLRGLPAEGLPAPAPVP